MAKIIVEGPDGKKYAFPDDMPRAEINAFMKQKYGTKAPTETVNDYLARMVREQDATAARKAAKDKEATAAGREAGAKAAERMGIKSPLMMAAGGNAIALAERGAAGQVMEAEGTILPDEAAGLSALNSLGAFIPSMVNQEFGNRLNKARTQNPEAALVGDVAGGFLPGEVIGGVVSKAVQAIGPEMAQVGKMFQRGGNVAEVAPAPAMAAGTRSRALDAAETAFGGMVGAGTGAVTGQQYDLNGDGVINETDQGIGSVGGALLYTVGGRALQGATQLGRLFRGEQAGQTLASPAAMGSGALKSAAIKVKGKVYTGKDHYEAVQAAERDGLKIDSIADAAGFVDANGKFLPRDSEEAIYGALAAGQIKDPARLRVIESALKSGKPVTLTSDMLDFGTAGTPPKPMGFAGQGARTANKPRLIEAQKMESAGKRPEEIWTQTGWMKGDEGKWRFEIDDSAARFEEGRIAEGQSKALGSIMQHSKLYAAYPELADLQVKFEPMAEGMAGMWRSTGAPLKKSLGTRLGPELVVNSKLSPEEVKLTILHETQHAIQEMEGFAGAAMPDSPGYWTAPGEVEARLVESRVNLDAIKRRQKFPKKPKAKD